MLVTVAYALPHEQALEELDVPDSTTAEQAIHMSHVLERFPEIDLKEQKIGVFGKLVTPDYALTDGDRVEIYRALPRKPRDAHAADDKKARIRASRERKAADSDT